jgi:stringent starvation protein B
MSESSTKPYLIRAIYEWCTDNGFTPYLAVAVDDRTVVPLEFVKAGEIVLNVSMSATDRLKLGNDLITFSARFGGVARQLSVPIDTVSAIYARETGHGMAFEVPKALAVADEGLGLPAQYSSPEAAAQPGIDEPPPSRRAPSLSSVPPSSQSQDVSGADGASALGASPEGNESPDPSPDGGGPRGGRPYLTRVK